MSNLFTTIDYENAKEMTNEEMLEVLQMIQEGSFEVTKYHGQEDYVGSGADYSAWCGAQALTKTINILDTLFGLLNSSEGDDEEDWGL